MRARRILVALDGSPESRAALVSAARLAIPAEAEITGLFVEDVELLRLAGLPFAREAGVSSGVFRRLDLDDIERRFRLAAERAREALREVAGETGVRSSFRVTRGRVVPELLAAAPEAGVVAAGRRSGHTSGSGRLGGTLRSLIARLPVPVLVGGARAPRPGPAVVVPAGAEVTEEALRFGALLARAFGAPEVVILEAEGPGPGGAEAAGPPVRRRGVSSLSASRVRGLPEVAQASAVLIVRREGDATHELLLALAESLACPVFVIGPGGLAELLSA